MRANKSSVGPQDEILYLHFTVVQHRFWCQKPPREPCPKTSSVPVFRWISCNSPAKRSADSKWCNDGLRDGERERAVTVINHPAQLWARTRLVQQQRCHRAWKEAPTPPSGGEGSCWASLQAVAFPLRRYRGIRNAALLTGAPYKRDKGYVPSRQECRIPAHKRAAQKHLFPSLQKCQKK